jgi:predicted DNA-binding WGR domain protein
MRNWAELEAMLQARLDLRYQECTAARAKWRDATSDAEQEAATVEWGRISDRAEATRKALLRTKYGVPYWRLLERDRAAGYTTAEENRRQMRSASA